MANRPNYLDIRSHNYKSETSSLDSTDLPSPRTGEIPPALSPLDAFALQGRMLAKRFEEQNKDGKRISRLPPLAVEHEFRRPSYFRTASSGSPMREEMVLKEEDSAGNSPQEALPNSRPKSQYPLIESSLEEDLPAPPPLPTSRSNRSPHGQYTPTNPNDYFSMPRSVSPDSMANGKLGVVQLPTPQSPDRQREQQRQLPLTFPRQIGRTGSPALSQRSFGLAPPPRSTGHQQASPTIRSVPDNMGDDHERSFLADSSDSLPPPQLSTGSTWSRSHSPASPLPNIFPRSPSVSSEYSASNLQRPTFNFSRPISRASGTPVGEGPTNLRQQLENFAGAEPRGSLDQRPSIDLRRSPMPDQRSQFDTRPSMDAPRPSFDANRSQYGIRPSFDLPSRQTSVDSYVTANSPALNSSRSWSGDNNAAPVPEMAGTPASTFSEDASNHSATRPRSSIYSVTSPGAAPAPSYTYSKFQLPRGRNVEQGGHSEISQLSPRAADDNFVGHPSTLQRSFTPPSAYDRRPSTEPRPAPESLTPHSRSLSIERPQPKSSPSRSRLNRMDRPSSSSAKSETSTVKAPKYPFKPVSTEVTAEAHLDKGIELHERGALQESTYHLRLAARAEHPTGMLLYALACRHGWGMRPSQAEGVQWLRKAVESTQLEVVEEDKLPATSTTEGADGKKAETAANGPRPGNVLERREHKARFALGVYELGVSYMNGWGIAKDATLALRCFEIAGSWGDADALAEAGFCYTEGVGCKKDLKKAAKYYRKAEAKGMSMAGNSWIYKEKYMDKPSKDGKKDNKSKNKEKEKEKERERERGREVDTRAASQDHGSGERGRLARNDTADDGIPTLTKKKQVRDKSRTRAIFGRKK